MVAKEIEKLKDALNSADAILVGAGSGLSTSAGFTYSGERFAKYFADFAAKYGFADMYSGGFYPYATPEEKWAYWSRYVMVNRYMDAPKPVYQKLFSLVQNKDYFVLTTNVDHCFQKAGFDKNRLFYTQGDYGLFQCSKPCLPYTYDNEKQIRKMWEAQKDMRIPSELVPRCPICGRPMEMNLRADSTFVEGEGWHMAAKRYSEFLNSHRIKSFRSIFGKAFDAHSQTLLDGSGKKILLLELGVGGNTPGIIKYPFWQMTAMNPNVIYACVNFNEAFAPDDIKKQSICVNGDIGEILNLL